MLSAVSNQTGITKNVKPGRFMDNYDEERASHLADAEPLWDEALYLFDVTDITSDIHITLLDKVRCLLSS